jgi:hypothetical protein
MIELTENGLMTSAPELAQEAADRVIGGALKAARAYVPTRENAEGKKEHCDVSLHNGKIYVGTDHSVYAAVITMKLHELCKKRSPLRAAVEQMQEKACARLNYGDASPWLKTHKANIKVAEIGTRVTRMTVVEGVVELDLSPTPESTAYAVQVAALIEERVRDDMAIAGPHEMPGLTGDSWVVVVGAEGIRLEQALAPECTDTQVKLRASMLPGCPCTVTAYEDPNGDRIVRFVADTPTMKVEQFFRVLVV